MTFEQVERLYWQRPFQPFDMLLSDQRTVSVANLDFLSLSTDHRTLTVCTLPDQAEVIDVLMVVSLKFRESDLTTQLSSARA